MKINTDQRTIEITDGGDIDLDAEEFTFEGERLTEARAEGIAREVSRKHGRKGGRPSLSEGHSPQIVVRVPQAT